MVFDSSLLKFCQKCGAKCCKYGSTIVLPKERQKIINLTRKDVFIRKNSFFIIPENPCPFLKNNLCTIESIKPLDCRAYPVGLFKKDNKIKAGISQKCPFKDIITKKYLSQAEKLFDSLTDEQKKDLTELNEFYGYDFKD